MVRHGMQIKTSCHIVSQTFTQGLAHQAYLYLWEAKTFIGVRIAKHCLFYANQLLLVTSLYQVSAWDLVAK